MRHGQSLTTGFSFLYQSRTVTQTNSESLIVFYFFFISGSILSLWYSAKNCFIHLGLLEELDGPVINALQRAIAEVKQHA
jgi:hypothetical protein